MRISDCSSDVCSSDLQFGKSTEAAARFAGTVKNAGTAVEAVGARINDLTKKMARLGQQDFLPKQRMLRAQSDLRAVEKEVRSVGAAMERLNTKARLNGRSEEHTSELQ